MSQERRRKVEHELDEWRQARRRGDAAEPGSEGETEAREDSDRHRIEFERLTELTRDEQRHADERNTAYEREREGA